MDCFKTLESKLRRFYTIPESQSRKKRPCAQNYHLAPRLNPGRDADGFHFAVEVAALEAGKTGTEEGGKTGTGRRGQTGRFPGSGISSSLGNCRQVRATSQRPGLFALYPLCHGSLGHLSVELGAAG